MIEQLALPLLVRGDARRHLSSQQERCLRIMRAAQRGGYCATNRDFIIAGLPNFRSRLSELRRAGYLISAGEYIAKGLYGYRIFEGAR